MLSIDNKQAKKSICEKKNKCCIQGSVYRTEKNTHEVGSKIIKSKFFSFIGKWPIILGSLTQIDHGMTTEVWGVNVHGQIYRLKGDHTWMNIPGSLKHVSVGEAGIWGVNRNDDIYFRRDGSTWMHIPGKLKQIDSGSGTIVYGVNSNDDIYCRLGKLGSTVLRWLGFNYVTVPLVGQLQKTQFKD